MKVFISWSGERSRLLAEALREWLPVMLHYVEPWFSDTDIRAGDRWPIEIGEHLQESDYGIICLTRENLEAPWVLFEAGAVAKSLDRGAVCPYLLGLEISEVGGPLSQFQAKKVDKASTYEILEAINEKAPDQLTSDRLKQMFELAWPKYKAQVDNIPPAEEGGPVREESEILEDLVLSVRSLERHFRDSEGTEPVSAGQALKEVRKLAGKMSITLDQLEMWLYGDPVEAGAFSPEDMATPPSHPNEEAASSDISSEWEPDDDDIPF